MQSFTCAASSGVDLRCVGNLDTDRITNLLPRHDDSVTNIQQRLELWDAQFDMVCH